MRIKEQILGMILMLTIFGAGSAVHGQMVNGGTDTIEMIKTLENQTKGFRHSVRAAFDPDNVDGKTQLRGDFTALIDALKIATDELRDGTQRQEETISDVKNVLGRAFLVELMMRVNKTSPKAELDWAHIRKTLNRLARTHRVPWVWAVNGSPYWQIISQPRVFGRLKKRSEEFRNSFESALDASNLNGTEREDEAIELVDSFEESVNRLEDKVSNSELPSRTDVELLLGIAVTINDFMISYELPARAQRDWARVRVNLDELAMLNDMIWRWSLKSIIPF